MIGTTFNQRFTLEKELGRGGMGAVYRATDQILQRSVAIKILKENSGDEVSRQLRLEAQILARLLHDNIVRLYDFGEADGTCYLVMEEVDGMSFVKRWRQLELPERLRVLAQTAEALDYAHHQGVIHRDIKPGNLLLTASDQAKLSDFGLSLLAEQTQQESGTIRGTPHYMSPEQARGKRLDHRSDLYSLGVMLYECATGQPPFLGATMVVIGQHVNEKPAPPRTRNPELSPELEALILGLLAKDPEARPSSGQAVASALREELARGPKPAVADETVEMATAPVLPEQPEPAVGAVPAPAPPPPAPPKVVPSKGAAPLARELLAEVLAEPIVLGPEERYLAGHYLAYLLAGSRRSGFLLRRPLDPRNADRARLLLAVTSAVHAGGTPEAIDRAVELIEKRLEVRASLNPIVIAKYVATRDKPSKLKRFRQIRRQIRDASPYAQKHLVDENGVLNPGLIPQRLADLKKIAPERSEVDYELVERWNRVAEVWRDAPDFRDAILRYATTSAHRDPASADLWPEVVHPLIERARWQRSLRPRHEALWDYISAQVLRVPDAGVRLDRAIIRAVPERVIEDLDLSLDAFEEEEPQIDAEPTGPSRPESEDDRLSTRFAASGVSLDELAADRADENKGVVWLVSPEPIRFTQGTLHDLWLEAMAALRKPGTPAGHRHVPVGGPYRLTVIPSVRGRSAGQVVLQGMTNKQIEMLTPSLRLGGSSTKPLVAVWVYQDNSAVTAYVDFQSSERYILWHAPNAQQFNFETAADLNHMLYTLGLEALEQLDKVLTKRYRPRKPV